MTHPHKDALAKTTIEKYIAHIEAHEMAWRIASAFMMVEKPQDMTAEQALSTIEEKDPQIVSAFYRAALAAAEYLEESINNFQRVQ